LEGRIDVHLGDLKDKLKDHYGGKLPYGVVSNLTRTWMEAYLEGRLTIMSKEVVALIEQGLEEEAVQLLFQDIVELRMRRMKANTAILGKKKNKITESAVEKAKKDKAMETVEKMLQIHLKKEKEDESITETRFTAERAKPLTSCPVKEVTTKKFG